MYYLFLDDLRHPKDVQWLALPTVKWTIVRNYNSFVDTINARGLPQIISFDHDLADEHYKENIFSQDIKNIHRGNFNYAKMKEKTGYDCAKFLVEYCLRNRSNLPEYYIHSLNYIGKHNIFSLLESYKKFENNN